MTTPRFRPGDRVRTVPTGAHTGTVLGYVEGYATLVRVKVDGLRADSTIYAEALLERVGSPAPKPERAGTLAGSTNGTTPTAEAVVDGPDHSVLLDLGPVASSLLGDLARAVHDRPGAGSGTALVVLGNVPPSDWMYAHSLATLTRDPRVMAALQVLITPPAADALAEQLSAAAVEPDPCARSGCDNLADRRDGLCAPHRAAADAGRWNAGGRAS
jgi:hypothetical protein